MWYGISIHYGALTISPRVRIHKILLNVLLNINSAYMYVCLCVLPCVRGCVPACLHSHPRLLPAASDQQLRGGQRSGPDQREDATAARCRQQRGPVDGPHEHGRAQWDRQQQQYTVMDIHSHMPRHIPAVTTLIWYHIYRYLYIGIYTQEKCITHTHTQSISYIK